MTPRELFNSLMDTSDKMTRCEVLETILKMTKNFDQDYTEALLYDLETLLFEWKDDEHEKMSRAIYWKEIYEPYLERLRIAQCMEAFGCSEQIEWPEEPAPFIPPCPGIWGDVEFHVPETYHYAVEVLKNHTRQTIEGDGALNTAPDGRRLPSELDTPEANKYFARAEAVGMMERTDMGGKWKSAAARLGYVCCKIFPQPRPIAALEKYFGVTKLSASITQAGFDAIRADVKKWRAEIDSKIFYD